ncbi:MAG: LysM peptidoglycan-binding domain-containing protein [Planctomycetes bacterium]|nr:LysM peptidoglycan-binding domain-containing protein [Planctomycetota bacterium]
MGHTTKLIVIVLLLAAVTFGVCFGYLSGGDEETIQNSITTEQKSASTPIPATGEGAAGKLPAPGPVDAATSAVKPAGPAAGATLGAPAPGETGSFEYVFAKGDNVFNVLARFGRPREDFNKVMELNPTIRDFGQVPVGARVRIPGAPPAGYVPAQPAGRSPASSRPTPGAGPARITEADTHKVQPGETLEEIARAHYGDPRQWKRIQDANPGINPNNIKPGQSLKLPK